MSTNFTPGAGFCVNHNVPEIDFMNNDDGLHTKAGDKGVELCRSPSGTLLWADANTRVNKGAMKRRDNSRKRETFPSLYPETTEPSPWNFNKITIVFGFRRRFEPSFSGLT